MSADSYDVIVVGSGSAGSSAAISAARAGARTLLVDRLGFMGGTSTAVLDTFYAFYTPGEQPRRVVGGLGWEVVERLTEQGVAFERPNTYGAGTGVTYDQETLKLTWEQLATDSGLDLLLHTWATGVHMDGTRVAGIRIWNKGGERSIGAKVVIDASGDADVSAFAGTDYEDMHTSGKVQSLSTLFRLANVDVERAAQTKKADMWALMREAAATGDYALPRLEGSWHRTPFAGIVMVHMTRIPNIDATDPVALTGAEIEGRRQVREYHRFLRDRVPGFEKSVVVGTSPSIGVRESRRVIGDYQLTRSDVLEARRFDDEIALCGAPIEDHGEGGGTEWQYVADGAAYGIPYRALLPRRLDGLLVAGRCFSSTHDAHASARSMATCMAMGQAAGTAAYLAVAGNCLPRDVSADTLRTRLRDGGAILGAMTDPNELRNGALANAVRSHRLIAILRRVEPQDALLALVDELADAGVRIIEITFDSPTAAADVRALRSRLDARGDGTYFLGAGTLLRRDQLATAIDAGAQFCVSPVMELDLLHASVDAGVPFTATGMTSTEAYTAWNAGATFIKLFPASAVGPQFIREMQGPLPDIQFVPSGGVDATNARAFLDAGAAAVGLSGALVRATSDERRALITSLR